MTKKRLQRKESARTRFFRSIRGYSSLGKISNYDVSSELTIKKLNQKIKSRTIGYTILKEWKIIDCRNASWAI